MDIQRAREKIKKLEEYIEKVENYQADTFDKKIFLNYVLSESVTKVTKMLNDEGYRIGNRKLVTTDVSNVIRSKPTDEMHEMARKLFLSKKKRAASYF